LAKNVIELKLEKWAHGGEVLGHLPDGRAVFVPYALPGEVVRARVIEEKKHYVRTELVEVLQSVPERIPPRCQHFNQCGGCHLQHLSYSHQLELKVDVLRDQLMRIGGIHDVSIFPIRPSPGEWFYRNSLQFHLTPGGKPGFRKMNSHEVIEIKECYLPEKAVGDMWQQLDLEPIPDLERVELRQGWDDEVMVIFESKDPQPVDFEVDVPLSAIHLGPGGPIVLSGDDCLVMGVGEKLFRVSPSSFFQVNTQQAAGMVAYVLSEISPSLDMTLLDVYCGVGLFSAFLAPYVGKCIGVEMSSSAATDFAVNLDELDNVSLYEGLAEDILPALDIKPDVILVDPPRSGIELAALKAISAMRAPLLIYVSCDPATLARDLRFLLAEGYRLEHVTPFDMFPQTYHTESISTLRYCSGVGTAVKPL
jgi:23S rRNA (uracil1939-C5)-methyltransferase